MRLSVAFPITLAVVALLGAFPAVGVAQDVECSYDECALRLRVRAFAGVDVVRGMADERVAKFSFFGFAPDLRMLSGRVDSAGVHYDAFRRINNRGALLESVALAALVASVLVVTVDQDNVGVGVGLALGGIVPLYWGLIDRVRGRDRLRRAIWWYNRGLN